jgi:hypothetical protein
MSGHAHDETCACGKDGTEYAHGYDHRVVHSDARRDLGAPISLAAVDGHKGYPVEARQMNCVDVLGIRARVAADLTRGDMNPAQRAVAWMQGRGGEYTDAAWQAAWAAPSDTPAQVDGMAR